MGVRAYVGGLTRASPSHYITIGILRRSGHKVEIGCRACNHTREIALASLELPAALPLASAPRYLNCVVCGASNSDTDQPIYLTSLE
jgi:hypothetical protein